MNPSHVTPAVEHDHCEAILKQREDELALAIHLANSCEIPLSVQLIDKLAMFIAEDVGGHGSPFQTWVEEMSLQRRQIQEEDKLLRAQKITMDRRVNRLEEQLNGQLTRLQEETVKASSIIGQLEARVKDLELQLSESSIREKDLENQLSGSQEKNAEISKKLEGFVENLRAEREKSDAALLSLQDVEEQLRIERSARSKVEMDCSVSDELAAQLLVEQEVSQRLRESVQALQHSKEDALQTVSRMKCDVEELQQSNSRLEDQLESRKLLVLRLEGEVASAQAKIQHLEQEHEEYKSSLTKKMTQVQNHLQRLKDERTEMLSARPILESQISQLECAIENIEREHEGTLCELAQEHASEIDELHREHSSEVLQLMARLRLCLREIQVLQASICAGTYSIARSGPQRQARHAENVGCEDKSPDALDDSSVDDCSVLTLTLRGTLIGGTKAGNGGETQEAVIEEVIKDVVDAVGVEASRLHVTPLCTVLRVAILKPNTPARSHHSHQVANSLLQQAADCNSLLANGRRTCNTMHAALVLPLSGQVADVQVEGFRYKLGDDDGNMPQASQARTQAMQGWHHGEGGNDCEIDIETGIGRYPPSKAALRTAWGKEAWGKQSLETSHSSHPPPPTWWGGVRVGIDEERDLVRQDDGQGHHLSTSLTSHSTLTRDPLTRDPLTRDPLTRDPLSRDPFSRDTARDSLSRELAIRNAQLVRDLEKCSHGLRAAERQNSQLASELKTMRAALVHRDKESAERGLVTCSPTTTSLVTAPREAKSSGARDSRLSPPAHPPLPLSRLSAPHLDAETAAHARADQTLVRDQARMRKRIQELTAGKEKADAQVQELLQDKVAFQVKVDKLTQETAHLSHRLADSQTLAAAQKFELSEIQTRLESLCAASAEIESSLVQTAFAVAHQQALKSNLSRLREQNLLLASQVRQTQELLFVEQGRAGRMQLELDQSRSTRDALVDGIEQAKLCLQEMDAVSPEIDSAARAILNHRKRLKAEVVQWRRRAENAEKELACKKSEIFTFLERLFGFLSENNCEVPPWLHKYREGEVTGAILSSANTGVNRNVVTQIFPQSGQALPKVLEVKRKAVSSDDTEHEERTRHEADDDGLGSTVQERSTSSSMHSCNEGKSKLMSEEFGSGGWPSEWTIEISLLQICHLRLAPHNQGAADDASAIILSSNFGLIEASPPGKCGWRDTMHCSLTSPRLMQRRSTVRLTPNMEDDTQTMYKMYLDEEIKLSTFWSCDLSELVLLDGRPVELLVDLHLGSGSYVGRARVAVQPGAAAVIWTMVSTDAPDQVTLLGATQPIMLQLRVAYSSSLNRHSDGDVGSVVPQIVGNMNMWKLLLIDHTRSALVKEQQDAKAKRRLERRMMLQSPPEDILLPSGWRTQVSRRSGKIFYRHKETGELSWKPPRGSSLKAQAPQRTTNSDIIGARTASSWSLQVTVVQGTDLWSPSEEQSQCFCCISILAAGATSAVGSSRHILTLDHFVGDGPMPTLPTDFRRLKPQQRTQSVVQRQIVQWHEAIVFTHTQRLLGVEYEARHEQAAGEGGAQMTQDEQRDYQPLDGSPVAVFMTVHTTDAKMKTVTIGRLLVPVGAGPLSELWGMMMDADGQPVLGSSGRASLICLRAAYGQPYTQRWPAGEAPCLTRSYSASETLASDDYP